MKETVENVIGILPKGWELTVMYSGGHWAAMVESEKTTQLNRPLRRMMSNYKWGVGESTYSMLDAVQKAVDHANDS